MFKLFAVILISAVCMSPVVQGSSAGASASNAAAGATASEVQTLNPAVIDYLGYQMGVPFLAPNVGPFTSLYAAALQPRSLVAKSNAVLARYPLADHFIGESSLGMVVV